jgi:hypothetical protein
MTEIFKQLDELKKEFEQMPIILTTSIRLSKSQKKAILDNLKNMQVCMKQLNDAVITAGIQEINNNNAS